MTINYTAKAKEDLIQLDWRLRHRIINILGKIQEEKRYSIFQKMHNSDYYKVNLANHLLICSYDEKQFNVLTVLEKKKLKFPE
jgi:mRNA-degrading endonuclease RelE of RelBE toxin-antitoxin system